MKAQTATTGMSANESDVRSLYRQLLDSWNSRNASDFAALYAQDGTAIGFDGSVMHGRAEIESTLKNIFENHPTSTYIAKIKNVYFLTPEVALVQAVAGMVPPGGSDIKPDVNAVQTLTAVRQQSQWRIALFQNTPAAFHGRPEMQEKLSAELREVLNAKQSK